MTDGRDIAAVVTNCHQSEVGVVAEFLKKSDADTSFLKCTDEEPPSRKDKLVGDRFEGFT